MSSHAHQLNCVKGEIHKMLSAMRLNQRWASSARFKREVPLESERDELKAFKTLAQYVETFSDLRDIDASRYLEPFLRTIRSKRASGAITGVALGSVNKFLLYGFISSDSIGARTAINSVARAICGCRFEATDPDADEVVLMKLLELMAHCLRSAAGPLIAPQGVWLMGLTCFKLAQLRRGSALLRQTARNTLMDVIFTVFSSGVSAGAEHTPSIVAAAGPAATQPEAPATVATVSSESTTAIQDFPKGSSWGDALEGKDATSTDSNSTLSQASFAVIGSANAAGTATVAAKPHNGASVPRHNQAPLLERLTRFLVSLVNPRLDAALIVDPPTGWEEGVGVWSSCASAAPTTDVDSEDGDLDGEDTNDVDLTVLDSDDPDAKLRQIVLGLTLINVVLETAGETLTSHSQIVALLQSDLCKFLLQNSQTDSLEVLSLTLRVVFNLFNSMKNHLKVQLEVFFTSVHLRIASTPISTLRSAEQKELALESLLEFCREPALMLDLYVNYDTDVHCTNLFETLLQALARNTSPESCLNQRAGAPLNSLNVLALEGLLAIISSISRRCVFESELMAVSSPSHARDRRNARKYTRSGSCADPQDRAGSSEGDFGSESDACAAAQPPRLERAGSMSSAPARSALDRPRALSADVIASPLSLHAAEAAALAPASPLSLHSMPVVGSGVSGSDSDADLALGVSSGLGETEDLQWLAAARERTAEALQRRKRVKQRMHLAAERFNSPKSKIRKTWIKHAQELGLLPNPADAAAVARFLRHTPGLDRTIMGDYLAEEPKENPFNAEVLKAYVNLFDFVGMTIDAALRKFLERFRLPGEAQKIDRLMEAFAGRLFEQNKGMPHSPFADADAAFVLTFALIMLHTDLHNDSIPEEKKMTVKQFFRNCEGINAGGNLPQPYLEALYGRIKVEEIHMMQDIATSSDAATTAGNWDGVMARTADVAGATFTLQADNVLTVGLRAGIHEREMFSLMNETSIGAAVTGASSTPGGMPPGGGGGDRSTTIFSALCLVFDASQDDTVVRRCIEGFEDYARIAAYYEMTEVLNYLCISLCRYFRHFALLHIAHANDNEHDDEQHASAGAEDDEHEHTKIEPLDTEPLGTVDVEDDTTCGQKGSQPTSTGVQIAGDATKNSMQISSSGTDAESDPDKLTDSSQMPGAARWTPRTACGRATLLLHTIFDIASRYGEGLREGWRNVLECVLLLNQLQAVPTLLPPAANMIVASDNAGGPLPLETFCDPLRSASGAVARRTPPLAPLQTSIARAARLGYMRCVKSSTRNSGNKADDSASTNVEICTSDYRRKLGELVQHLPDELRPPESVVGSLSKGSNSAGSSTGGVFGGLTSWFSSAVTSEATLDSARNRREAAAADLAQAASEAPLITPFVAQSRTLSEGALCEMLKAILLARDPVASKNASSFGFGQLSSAGLGMRRTREDAASLSSAAWLQGDPLQAQRDGVLALELACRVLQANSSAARAAVVWPLIAAYIERVLSHAHERAIAWATLRLRQRGDTHVQQAKDVRSSNAGTTIAVCSGAAQAAAAEAEACVHATNDADPERFDFLVERAVHSLLRCIGRLFVGRSEMRNGLLGGRRGLALLDKLDGTPLASALAPMRAAGLLWLLQNGIAYLDEGARPKDGAETQTSESSSESSDSSWDALTNALATAARHEGGRAAVWAAVRYLLDGGLVTPCNVQHVRSLLLLFVGEDGAAVAAATFRHSPRWSCYADHMAWRPGTGAGTAYASPADAVYALKQIVTPALEASFHAASKTPSVNISAVSYPMPPSSPAACWLELMYLLGHRLLRARDRTVARAAWGALAEILAMPTVSVEPPDWAHCFEGLLFPLALASRESAPMVADSAVAQSATASSPGGLAASGGTTIEYPHGLGPLESTASAAAHGIGGFESADAFYLRVATLLSRTFLHNVGTLAALRNFQVLWLRLVRLMALDIDTRSKLGSTASATQSSVPRNDGGYDGDEGFSDDEQTLMRGSRSRSEGASDRTADTAPTGARRAMGDDGLREVLRETSIQALKNIVMVMHADGVFERVSEQSGQDLWALTATVLDIACPQLKIDIDDAVRAGTDCAANIEGDGLQCDGLRVHEQSHMKGCAHLDSTEDARLQHGAQAQTPAEAESESEADLEAESEIKRLADLEAAEKALVQTKVRAQAAGQTEAEAQIKKKRLADLAATDKACVQTGAQSRATVQAEAEAGAEAEADRKRLAELEVTDRAHVQSEAQARMVAQAEAAAKSQKKETAELKAADEVRVQVEAKAQAAAEAEAQAKVEDEMTRRAEITRVQTETLTHAEEENGETKITTVKEVAQTLSSKADGRAPMHGKNATEQRISGLVRAAVSGSLGITLRAADLRKDKPADSGITANVLIEHIGDTSPLQGKVNVGDGIVCIAGQECGGASLDSVVQLLRDTSAMGPREIVFECAAPVFHSTKQKAPHLLTGFGTGPLGTIGASPRPGSSRATPDPGQTLRAATVARARSAAPKVRDAVALSQSMNQVATPAHKIVATEHEFVEQTVSGALGLNLDTGTPGCATVTGVAEGSPFVGLVRAGAQIIAVDDIDCCDKGLDVVVQILRSTAGKPRVIRLSQRRLPAKPAALPAMPPV